MEDGFDAVMLLGDDGVGEVSELEWGSAAAAAEEKAVVRPQPVKLPAKAEVAVKKAEEGEGPPKPEQRPRATREPGAKRKQTPKQATETAPKTRQARPAAKAKIVAVRASGKAQQGKRRDESIAKAAKKTAPQPSAAKPAATRKATAAKAAVHSAAKAAKKPKAAARPQATKQAPQRARAKGASAGRSRS